MAKEWILNGMMNRFQLNFSKNVGRTSESIRACTPKTVQEWEEYYFKNVRSKEHLAELGQRLYVKITEVIPAEVEAITEEDCIQFINDVVIKRTFDGYMTEIKTVYSLLQILIDHQIKPASDEWDRLFNVDFFIEVNGKFIGLQIKPAGNVSHIPQIHQEHSQQHASHKKFTEQFGGKVFYIYSIKDGQSKKIYNTEVIEQIKTEIERLSS